MTTRTTKAILDDIARYAEYQRRGVYPSPDTLLGLVKELRTRDGYNEEYHSITNSGIGLAKMALLRDDPRRAMECLQATSRGIDRAILKFFPTSAKALGIIEDEKRNHTACRPPDSTHHRQVLPAD